MPKRVIQHATSGARRTKRAKKPTTPWRRGRNTEVPQEIIDAQPPDCRDNPKWVYKGQRDGSGGRSKVHKARSQGYVDAKLPKGGIADNIAVGGGYERQDCKLMFLPNERKEARDYDMQQRAESHLTDTAEARARKVEAAGFITKQDEVREDDGEI